jgi:hypothetical protein
MRGSCRNFSKNPTIIANDGDETLSITTARDVGEFLNFEISLK